MQMLKLERGNTIRIKGNTPHRNKQSKFEILKMQGSSSSEVMDLLVQCLQKELAVHRL
jgi:hypothetical protein